MLLTFFSSIPFYGLSQSPADNIPPSPEAYSLGKYGDIPVGLYTGVPDISIPIFALEDDGAAVNVSLSYHGSGIKVDEAASLVGLGWSLNAGGVITRVVKGAAEKVLSDGTFVPQRAEIDFYTGGDYTSVDIYLQQNELYAASTNQRDPEPDHFYFNFNGRAGKFYFDKNGTALLEKQEGLAIEWKPANNHTKFIIKDEFGVIYEFADLEYSFDIVGGANYVSAWYLSKVVSPTGGVIAFEYENTSANQYVRASSTYLAEVFPNTNIASTINATPHPVPDRQIGKTGLRISKISSDNGWIEFKLKPEQRRDYGSESNLYPLEEIRVYKSSGALLKRYRLSTSYFEANDSHKYMGDYEADYGFLNYRLRLDQLQEFSGDSLVWLPPYRFDYLGDNDPTTDDPYTLPYRLSPSQDHWGYYNQSYNSHLFPGNSDRQAISGDTWYWTFEDSGNFPFINMSLQNGANREIDAEAVKAGLLSQIHYPTGGYSEFFFEANQSSTQPASLWSGVRIRKIRKSTGFDTPTETVYTYEGYENYSEIRKDYYKYFDVSYSNGEPNLSSEFLDLYGLPSTNPGGTGTESFVQISTLPQAVLGPGANIGYSSVTVSESGNGYTTHLFASSGTFPDYTDNTYIDETLDLPMIFNSEYVTKISNPYDPSVPSSAFVSLSPTDFPFLESYSNNWKRGVLTDRGYHSNDSTLIKTEHYEYHRQLLSVIPGYKALTWRAGQEFITGRYFVPNGLIQLKKTTVKRYDQNSVNPITSVTENFYDNPGHLQPTRIEVTRSDGGKETTATTFPLDYAQGTAFIDSLKANHFLAYPIEQVRYSDSGGSRTILSGRITKYKESGSGLKDQELFWESQSVPSSSFKFSNRPLGQLPSDGTPVAFGQDAKYEERLSYTYDGLDNLQTVQREDGEPVSYLWGYNNSLPIAQVLPVRLETAEETDTLVEPLGLILTQSVGTETPLGELTLDRAQTISLSYSVTRYGNVQDVMFGVTVKDAAGTVQKTWGFYNQPETISFALPAGSYTFFYTASLYSEVPSPSDAANVSLDASYKVTVTRKNVFHTSFEEDGAESAAAKTGRLVHKGNYSLSLPAEPGRYSLSYWRRPIAGGEWELVTTQVEVTTTGAESVQVGDSNSEVDEVRLHPTDAQMTTYTYDPLVGMTSSTDANNRTTYYEYDAFGRLQAVKDEEGNILQSHGYHYAGE